MWACTGLVLLATTVRGTNGAMYCVPWRMRISGFRYVTGPSANDPGVFIDDIKVYSFDAMRTVAADTPDTLPQCLGASRHVGVLLLGHGDGLFRQRLDGESVRTGRSHHLGRAVHAPRSVLRTM